MRKLRIYLDTSVINFLFADDAPEKRDITRSFFAHRLREYDVAISEVVLAELSRTGDSTRREKLMNAVVARALPVIRPKEDLGREVARMAGLYLAEGVLPASQKNDAFHLALCTVLEFDVLLSWNFHHLANIKKQIRVNAINAREGYCKPLSLLTPLETMDEDEDDD